MYPAIVGCEQVGQVRGYRGTIRATSSAGPAVSHSRPRSLATGLVNPCNRPQSCDSGVGDSRWQVSVLLASSRAHCHQICLHIVHPFPVSTFSVVPLSCL
jgi:hypothetical protein